MTSTRSSREERKNSSFRRVFWWTMGYNRVLTFFYTMFVVGALPVGVLLGIIGNRDYYTDMSNWTESTPEEVAQMFGDTVRQSFNVQLTSLVIPLAILFLLVWCARNFSYMHGRRSVDLFHALPVRRTPLFMGTYAAGLISMLVPLAVSVGLTEVVCVTNGIRGVAGSPALFWQAFGLMALTMTASMTFTVFFMVVSGNLLNWFLSVSAVALGWPVICAIANFTMSAFLPGYVSVLPMALYTALSPYFAVYSIIPNGIYYMLASIQDGSYSVEPDGVIYNIPVEFVIWWVCFTLLLLALSVFYYGRRKSECAENAFSFPAARGAVRSLMTIGGSLGLGLVVGTLLDNNTAYFAGIVIGAVVAHTVFQVVITRGFRRFWVTIPAFVVTMALIGGGLYTLYTGGLGYVSRIPQAGDVERVDFTLPSVPGDESKECYLAVNNGGGITLLNKEMEWEDQLTPYFSKQGDVDAMCQFHSQVLTKYPGPYLRFGKKMDYNNMQNFTVTYTLKDGRTLQRDYTLPLYQDDENLLSALATVQKLPTYQSYILYYSLKADLVLSLDVYKYNEKSEYSAGNNELTAEQKKQVWATFTQEMNSPDFSEPSDLVTAEEAEKESNAEAAEDENGISSGSSDSFTISFDSIPLDQISPEIRALITEEYQHPIVAVEGISINVPQCCTKTRKLIDDLTKQNGETYYYNEDEDPADAGPADAS